MTTDVQILDGRAPVKRRTGVIIAWGFVMLLSLGLFFLAAIGLPRFAGIFREMHGDKPLPASTAAVLNFRWVLGGVAVVSALAASVVVQRRASLRYLLAILAILLLLITFTTITLFLPLIVNVNGLSAVHIMMKS